MKCSQARKWLSAYHDGELSAELRAQMSWHLQCCGRCAQELCDMRQLRDLAADLSCIVPPGQQWGAIQKGLKGTTLRSPQANTKRHWSQYINVALVASALFGMVALATLFRSSNSPHAPGHDVHLVANFDRFLNTFEHSPAAAQKDLCYKYQGRRVDVSQAMKLVGYAPLGTKGAPPGYTVAGLYVLDMPCCRCSETIYRRASGGLIAVFEHEDKAGNWFGERATTAAMCGRTATCIVQMKDQLAVTWRHAGRRYTAVGVADVTELMRLVQHVGGAT